MAVTRSWSTGRAAVVVAAVRGARRRRGEWVWLAGASVLVAASLAMVFAAKSQEFAAVEQKLARGGVVNLNRVGSAAELAPVLQSGEDAAERAWTAIERSRPLRNTGVLARVVPLAKLKPLLIVRTPREFEIAFLGWTALYFAGFYVVAWAWRATGFAGDRTFLPALHLLSGMGLALMVSLRDPLRDTLEFRKFALGVFLGCLLLILPALQPFHYLRLSDWCYTPLFLALALFGLLLAFGRGPAGNDAKVNLGPFQPVEAIKILLVIFLAGYFTRHWERLRDLREKRILPKLLRKLGAPRLEHMAPVAAGTAAAILIFFVLKDMGPALVTFFVFLAMFGTARGKAGLVMAGLAIMVAAVFVGYRMGQPRTVVERIDMWLSPWDNQVHGGDQLAHGLWAFSTGGPWGSGPGWGDPAMIPAGNTDLVLPAIGEEWGFIGVATVLLLEGFLVARGLRVAQRAGTHFGFFLGLGLATLLACEMLLISSGVLGVLPLSGVVSPFLSSGNTAMLANFAVVALLLSISAEGKAENPLLRSQAVAWALAGAAVVLAGAAARYQVFDDAKYLARDAMTFDKDGVKRPEHNPRMNSLAREIPRGTIYDRNGVPLATGDWAELERHAAEYEALGVDIAQACSRFDNRHYPFGGAMAHVVGDVRTGENFHASNASLVEHDDNAQLQGYDYAELAGVVRYRHQPGNPAIAAILARDRSVHLTIDIRLQMRAREILDRHLEQAGVSDGAVVVLDAATGDVLALVSAPAPEPHAEHSNDELLDRARYGEYPPGSTFKLVTAMAALRLDPELKHRVFLCHRLPDGRAGNTIAGWNRAIKDDIGDQPHGTLDMEKAITVSCNAYFAQLGVHDVGARALAETAAQFGIATGDLKQLQHDLPFASYGQGAVLVSPFKMARVAAAIAAGGKMPEGRWIADGSNARTDAPVEVLPAEQAQFLAGAMRRVVLEGTAQHVMAGTTVSMAGKTGTAQLDAGMPHAWFTGFAPYEGAGPRLAFAVLVEHGGYGGRVAAPIAREVMEAAQELGILH